MEKRRERQALLHVFGDYAAKAEDHERPDFLISHQALRHGVEITEMYPSPIEAKLQNLTGYTVGLLDGTQPPHRVDRDSLRVETISLLHEDGTKIDDVRAIFQPTPTHKEKLAVLLDTICEKSYKFDSYKTECDVVDLVVWDRGSLFGNEADFEVVHLAPSETRMRLISSPFREVFLLTRSPEPSRFFFYPLRANVFLSDALLVDHFFLRYQKEFSQATRLNVLCECLRRMGHPVALSSMPDGLSVHTPGWQLLISHLNVNLREWTTHCLAQPDMEPCGNLGTEFLVIVECVLASCAENRCSTTVALSSRAT